MIHCNSGLVQSGVCWYETYIKYSCLAVVVPMMASNCGLGDFWGWGSLLSIEATNYKWSTDYVQKEEDMPVPPLTQLEIPEMCRHNICWLVLAFSKVGGPTAYLPLYLEYPRYFSGLAVSGWKSVMIKQRPAQHAVLGLSLVFPQIYAQLSWITLHWLLEFCRRLVLALTKALKAKTPWQRRKNCCILYTLYTVHCILYTPSTPLPFITLNWTAMRHTSVNSAAFWRFSTVLEWVYR